MPPVALAAARLPHRGQPRAAVGGDLPDPRRGAGLSPTDAQLRELLAGGPRVAVVGCSSHWPKPPNVVAAYLKDVGFDIVPVNPHEPEVLGLAAAPSLQEVAGPIDVVDVFRPPEEAPALAAQAVELGARCLWLQTGIRSEEAERIAADAGLVVVADSCIAITHGALGLGPGVKAWKEARLPLPDGARGGSDPAVTVLEYGDYECPYSRLAFRAIERLEQELGDELRYGFRHFPRPALHPWAEETAAFVESAARQERRWEAHELVFHRQKALGHDSLVDYGRELGLDLPRLELDMTSDEVRERIAADVAAATIAGVDGTPRLFVNGVRYLGDSDYDQIAAVVKSDG